jgi:hypothetical protein
MTSAGCKHEWRHGAGSGSVEVELQVCEQLDHIHAAKRCGNMNGKRTIIRRSGSESRTVHAGTNIMKRIHESSCSTGKHSHVKKFGNILEVAFGRQMHGIKASSNCRRDISVGFGKEDDHFVNAAHNRDANRRGAVREDMVGVGLGLLQQILYGIHVSVPNGQFEPGQT